MDKPNSSGTKLPPVFGERRIGACPLACYIRLTKGKIAIIDPWWFVELNRHGWKAVKRKGGWYALKTIGKRKPYKYFYMHRIIMNTPKGMECHHKNRNTLDNREANLENVTVERHRDIRQVSRLSKLHEKKPQAGTSDLPMK